MLENQLIQFANTIDPLKHEIAVPAIEGANFFVKVAKDDGYENDTTIDLVSANGDVIVKDKVIITKLYNKGKNSRYAIADLKDIVPIAPNECFRLKVNEKSHFFKRVCDKMHENIPSYDIFNNKYKFTQDLGTFEGHKFHLVIKNLDVKCFDHGEYISVMHYVSLLFDGVAGKDQILGTGGDVSFDFEVDSAEVGLVIDVKLGGEYQSLEISYDEIYYISDETEQITYSNILRRVIGNDYSTIQYSCSEDAFGYPFSHKLESGTTPAINQTLPLLLTSPQYKQEDKIYTKRNGENVVLFANIAREYDGHTEYIPIDWHEKILMALSSDKVYINGERVTKSGNYEIDHDNCTYTDCGIKLMRATFKMTTNVTQRNSNY